MAIARVAAASACCRHVPARRAVGVEQNQVDGQIRPGLGKAGIEPHRLLVLRDRPAKLGRAVTGAAGGGRASPEKRVIRLRIPRRRLGEPLLRRARQRHAHRLRHLSGDVRLHLEHVADRRLERLLPLARRRAVAAHLHQLGAHLHPAGAVGVLGPAHRPGQQVLDARGRAAICAGVRVRAGVLHRAAARDHLELRQLGELAAHRVGDAAGEVGVGRVAQVLEGEDDDARGAAFGRGAVTDRPPPGEEHAEPDEHADHQGGGRDRHLAAPRCRRSARSVGGRGRQESAA